MAVFGLKKIYLEQLRNVPDYGTETVSHYGYFASGSLQSPGIKRTNVDRLDLQTDTVTDIRSRTHSGQFGSGTDGGNYGKAVIACGHRESPSATVTTITRLEYASDTTSASPVNATFARYLQTSASTPEYGYIQQGYQYPSAWTCLVDRFQYSNDTISNVGGDPEGRLYHAGFDDTQFNYYTAGEKANGRDPRSSVKRFDFSTDTHDSPSSVTSDLQSCGVAYGSNSHGYVGAGHPTTANPSYANASRVDSVEFATLTVKAEQPAQHPLYGGGTANTSEFGFTYGGYNGGPNVRTSNITRMDFGTGTVTLYPNGKEQISFASNGRIVGGNKVSRHHKRTGGTIRKVDGVGYLGGGSGPTYQGGVGGSNPQTHCTVDRIDWASDTYTDLGGIMSVAQREFDSGSTPEFAYYAGGHYPGNTNVPGMTSVDRLDYSCEVFSITGVLAGGSRIGKQVTSSKHGTGFWTEGLSNSAALMKFDYGTSTPSTGFSKSVATARCGHTYEDQHKGYFCGGNGSKAIQQYVFDTDTGSAHPISILWAGPNHVGEGMASQNTSFGYGIGGENPGLITCYMRMEFDTDLAVLIPGTGSNQKQGGATESTTRFNWTSANFGRKIQNVDFSTETTSVLFGYTNTTRGSNCGGGASFNLVNESLLTNYAPSGGEHGYWGGGYNGSFPSSGETFYDRLQFSNETSSRPSARVIAGYKGKWAGTASNESGYVFGGQTSDTTTERYIQKMDFATESTGTIHTRMREPVRGGACMENSNYGYFGGGYWSHTPPTVYEFPRDVQRFDFSNDIMGLASHISSGRSFLKATQSDSHGYFVGGNQYPTGYGHYDIDKIDFNTETNVSTSQILERKYAAGGGISENDNYGWLLGGGPAFPIAKSWVSRLDFNTDTSRTISANVTLCNGGDATESTSYGYQATGFSPPNSYYSSYQRIDFESDTVSNPGAKLHSDGRYAGACFRDSGGVRSIAKSGGSEQAWDFKGKPVSADRGYIAGGYVSLARTSVSRFDMTTESYDVLVNGDATRGLVHGKYSTQGINNHNYGYYFSANSPNTSPEGGPGGITTQIDRIEFSSETLTNFTSPAFPADSQQAPFVASIHYGYGTQGYVAPTATTFITNLLRMDFSNETIVDSGNNLPNNHYRSTNFANNNFTTGYFGGSYVKATHDGVTAQTIVSRLDFMTETSSRGGDLSGSLYSMASVRGPDAGYMSGGQTPVRQSTIRRYSFSTETESLPGSLMSGAISGHAGVHNENYGYFCLGYGPVLSYQTEAERLDFSNDATNTVLVANTAGNHNWAGYYGVGSVQNAP